MAPVGNARGIGYDPPDLRNPKTMNERIHPTPETLAGYVRGDLDEAENRRLEQHLVGCLACQIAVEEAGEPATSRVVRWMGGRFARPEAEVAAEAEAAAEAKAAADAAAAKAAERREGLGVFLHGLGHLIARKGEAALAALLAEPEHRRRRLLRTTEDRFNTLDLAERLEMRCRDGWTVDPAGSVELAKLAVLVAERADAAVYGARQTEGARVVGALHVALSQRLATTAETAEAAGEEAPPAEAVDTALREVFDAFLARRLAIDAVLVTLDRALLRVRNGQTAELRDMAAAAVAALTNARGQAYALDALRFLDEKAQAGEVTVEMLTAMRTFLQRARNNPRLRHEEV
jgi:hypothetical protein